MNNSKKWSNGIIILLSVLNLILMGFLWFGAPPPPDGPPTERLVHELQRALDLSVEQTTAFKALLEEHRKDMRLLSAQIYEKEDQYLAIDADPDLSKQIGKLQAQRAQLVIDHFKDLQGLFSKEQYEEFRRIQSVRKKHRRKRKRNG